MPTGSTPTGTVVRHSGSSRRPMHCWPALRVACAGARLPPRTAACRFAGSWGTGGRQRVEPAHQSGIGRALPPRHCNRTVVRAYARRHRPCDDVAMNRATAASVIFTTYNQPDWLEKVLFGFAAQDRADFEVLVADDGSDDRTRQCLLALQPLLPMPVRHLWQPDDGFRKCEALNMAIAAARSDYLVFTDGDCIPRADFVSTHLRERAPGRFL